MKAKPTNLSPLFYEALRPLCIIRRPKVTEAGMSNCCGWPIKDGFCMGCYEIAKEAK